MTAVQNVTPLPLKPSTSYVAVTPEMAARWLEGNVVNRNLRIAKVNQYARDMHAGRWTLNNDAICISPDGQLLNGQHRLKAVVNSGCTIVLLIARNIPAEAMANMDSGAARTAGDVLSLKHERNGPLLAAVAKQALLVLDGRIYQDNKQQAVSHGELAEFVEKNPLLRDSTDLAMRAYKQIDCIPTALGTGHFLIADAAGKDIADEYLRRLATRTREQQGSAILAVDSRLREIRRNRNRFPTRNFIYLLVKGYNYWMKGTPVAKITMTPKPGTEFRIPRPVTA